jgi:DNA (cytosine-5)-methyltransferase 1
MIYGSVCSGIEAATVAWGDMGWQPAWFAEIDPFCSSLLKCRYPNVKNYGDFTEIGDDAGSIDLLCGGTPCQDFSVAGLRAGLDGARGNLTLEFVKLAGRLRPRWLVWENVPGVLSIDGGRAFGAFLGGLAELGYGFAYRILNAQHFGVPQRRRRVFVVGYLGDWRPAAAVLFESHCLSGYPPPHREAGQATAPTLGAGPVSGGRTYGTDADSADSLIPATALCLNAKGGGGRIDGESETFVVAPLTSNPYDASPDGTGRGGIGVGACLTANAVRRLTPRECERLQGFPDDYTLIPYRGKSAADGPRYKALGNSWAVPVPRWIGQRIEARRC